MSEPWICNECGSRQYTGGVMEQDLRWLACDRCGGSEFHKPSDLLPVPGCGPAYPATEPDEDARDEYAREQDLEDAR